MLYVYCQILVCEAETDKFYDYVANIRVTYKQDVNKKLRC